MLKKIIVVSIIFLFNTKSFSALWWHDLWSNGEKVSGLSLLELPVGAKNIAMGNASVAVVQDPTANFVNPAGIAEKDNWQASFSHTMHFAGIRQEFMGATLKNNSNAFGVTFNGIFTDGIELVDEQQNSWGEYGAFSYEAGITYARNINTQLDLGVTVKSVAEYIYTSSFRGWAMDFGCNYALAPQLKLAFVLNNMGTSIDSVKLPFAWRLGAGYQKNKLLLSIEVSKYISTKLLNSIGAEYKLNEVFALRTGYILENKTENFTAGLGINLKRLQIDYAFKPYGIGLGPTHIFTITI